MQVRQNSGRLQRRQAQAAEACMPNQVMQQFNVEAEE
jgi:hypothetical protein